MHSNPQTVTIETEDFSDKFPRPGNGVSLEIIAETEIAEHLEEHEVSFGSANVVEVVVLTSSTDALLYSYSAVVWSNFITHEVRLEGHHSGHGEQQGGVVRNEAGRGNNRMATLIEETGKRRTQLVGATWR